MKVRCDFVTNSSSSSFILAFESKDVVAEELRNSEVIEKYDVGGIEGAHLQRLLWDILDEANEVSITEALGYAREDFSYDVHWAIGEELVREGIVKNHSEVRDWACLNEEAYGERLEKKIESSVKAIEEALEGNNYIVMVDYADDGGLIYSNLEHNIVPNLKCCKAVFNHH